MAGAAPGQNRGIITVCVMMATIMQALDTTIATVALPYMQGSLSATQDQINWVLTSYIVAAAITTPVTGFLAGFSFMTESEQAIGTNDNGDLYIWNGTVQALTANSVAVALGLVIIGQSVALLNKYGAGAQNYAGVVMVAVVVRELGPLVTALLVLARVGTAIVIDLSTQRALGEVEALEALGIDPIHYLVVPRVWGLAISIFSLTIYLIIISLIAGYLFAFVQDVPLRSGEYFEQLASSLRWEDFLLLGVKTVMFGTFIAIVTCYQGLAHPVRLEDVSNVTTNAVVESVIACVLIDALFGFAAVDALEGQPVNIVTQGCFSAPKAAGVVTQGQVLFYDAALKVLKNASAAGLYAVGVAIEGAGDTDPVVKLKLDGTSVVAVGGG